MIEYGILVPCSGTTAAPFLANRVDTQLGEHRPDHPAHVIYRAQLLARLPPKLPRAYIPLAKSVKTIEYLFGIEHTSDAASSVRDLRARALKIQIARLRSSLTPPRYASLKLHPAPATYILTDNRPTATLRARIRLNRHHFLERQHRLHLAEDSSCAFCTFLMGKEPQQLGIYGSARGPSESAEHILLHCPGFAVARYGCIETLRLSDVPFTIDVITGDVRSASSREYPLVQSATAQFLWTVNNRRPI